MKESQLVGSIKKWLEDDLQALVWKYHGNAYSVTGHADLYGVLGEPSGLAFFIEVKQLGCKPSPAQMAFLARCEAQGAVAFWTDSLDSCRTQLVQALRDRL